MDSLEKVRSLRRWPPSWDGAVAAVFCALFGALFSAIGMPVAWLLGPLVGGTLLAAWTQRVWSLPQGFQSVAQMILGLAVGVNVDVRALAGVGDQAILLVLLVIATLAASMYNGILLHRWAGIDRATGLLGSIPGAASSMVIMSHDLGLDPRVVAVLQYERVLGVALLGPVLVEHVLPLFGTEGLAFSSDAVSLSTPSGMETLAFFVISGILGALVARFVRLPSRNFLGPCLVAMVAAGVWGEPVHFPPIVFNAALFLFGTWIGLIFDLPLVRQLGRVTLINGVLILGLMGSIGALALLFSYVSDVGRITAFLGSAPGAMEVMMAASIELGADTPMVITMQMMRFLTTLLLGPWLAKTFIKRNGKPPRQGAAHSR